MSHDAPTFTAPTFQQSMPPFHLGHDLLASIFTAIPPPPPDATTAWRHARIARLIAETTALLPADAAQGRLAAQIIILREVADDTMRRSNAPAPTVAELCRLRRTAVALICGAERLERALTRRQQRPVPFWANAAADTTEVAALDAAWGTAAPPAEPTPNHQPPPLAPATTDPVVARHPRHPAPAACRETPADLHPPGARATAAPATAPRLITEPTPIPTHARPATTQAPAKAA